MSEIYEGDPSETEDGSALVMEDGDALDAASARVSLEALLNIGARVTALHMNRFHDSVINITFDSTSYQSVVGTPGVAVGDCEIGDVLLIWGSCVVTMNGTSDSGAILALFQTDDNAGTPTAETIVDGSERLVNKNLTASALYTNLPWSCVAVVTEAGTTRIRVKGKVLDADDDCTIGIASMTVFRLRGVTLEGNEA